MPQYKDIDAILKKLPDDLPYKASVKRVLMQAPEADVVPREECEKWYHEYHKIKDELRQEKEYHRATEKAADKYFADLQSAKAEVARQIFEEMFYIIRRYEVDALMAGESYGILLVRNFGSEILKLKNKRMEETDGKQA